jgi:triphosphoribosyl-dephospho-CoA synthetase
MQPSALCAPAGSRPNRWETLCALQGLLPHLKKAAADLGHAEMVYWFEQADAEVAKIIRGQPSDTTAIPTLIASSPQGRH